MLLTCKIKEKKESDQAGEGTEIEKTYTYSQLKDLQSKLTLVAGEQQEKNRETIQTFDDVSILFTTILTGDFHIIIYLHK